jgi:hypothetical protein
MRFHESTIGVRFLEGSFPEFIKELRRLNDNLEAERKNRMTRDPSAVADWLTGGPLLYLDVTCGSCEWDGIGQNVNRGLCPVCRHPVYPANRGSDEEL